MKLHESVVWAVRQNLETATYKLQSAERRIAELEMELSQEREQLSQAAQWVGELRYFLEVNNEKPLTLAEWQLENDLIPKP